MSIPKVELAKCCATCKFGSFHKTNNASWYCGTKMSGVCVHDEVISILPEKPYRILLPYPAYMVFDLLSIYKTGKDYYGHTSIPTVEEFVEETIKQTREKFPGIQEVSIDTERRTEILKEWYNKCKEYDGWWKDNGDNVRFIHRATVCSSYEEGGRRSPTAKSLVKKAQGDK